MELPDVDLFAGLAVADARTAASWYERLLGVAVTFWAHEQEAVWVLAEHRAVYVVADPVRAGRGLVTLMVDGLDGVLDAAAGRGVVPTRVEEYGGGVRKAVFHDPDGNEVGIGEAPGA